MDNFEHNSVVLIGFMGCGKSCVARALAAHLNREAVDIDTLIEQAAGKPIPVIFRERGEEAFRRLETEQLRAALEHSGAPRIIATGGGIVTREQNRELLKAAAKRGLLVVYLCASSDVLARRIRQQPGQRPLIDGGKILNMQQTRERVTELLAERAPLYESVANLIVETGTPAPAVVAHEIEQALGAQRASRPPATATI